jgi:hypothetical protein
MRIILSHDGVRVTAESEGPGSRLYPVFIRAGDVKKTITRPQAVALAALLTQALRITEKRGLLQEVSE